MRRVKGRGVAFKNCIRQVSDRDLGLNLSTAGPEILVSFPFSIR